MFLKNYLNKKKIKQFFIILFFLQFSCNLPAFENKKINEISQDKFNQLNSLLNNQFFDPRRNKQTKIFQLMYFALSKDGQFSSISICDTNAMSYYDCIDINEKSKTQKNCEKISKQKCFIIVSKNKLLLNEKNYFLKKKAIMKYWKFLIMKKLKF